MNAFWPALHRSIKMTVLKSGEFASFVRNNFADETQESRALVTKTNGNGIEKKMYLSISSFLLPCLRNSISLYSCGSGVSGGGTMFSR
jgi:hypothetical protein